MRVHWPTCGNIAAYRPETGKSAMTINSSISMTCSRRSHRCRATGIICLLRRAAFRRIQLLRVQTEIRWSQSTIRGNVHIGTSQQGDGPTTNLCNCLRLLFLCALRSLSTVPPSDSHSRIVDTAQAHAASTLRNRRCSNSSWRRARNERCLHVSGAAV